MNYAMTAPEVRLSLQEIRRRRQQAMGEAASQGMEGVRGGILGIEEARKAREEEMHRRAMQAAQVASAQGGEERARSGEERATFDHQAKRAASMAQGADLHALSVAEEGPQPYQRGFTEQARGAGLDKVSEGELGSFIGKRAETLEESRRAREEALRKQKIEEDRESRASEVHDRDRRRERVGAAARAAARYYVENQGDHDGEESVLNKAHAIQRMKGMLPEGLVDDGQARAELEDAIAAERQRLTDEGMKDRDMGVKETAAAARGAPKPPKPRDNSTLIASKIMYKEALDHIRTTGMNTGPFRKWWEENVRAPTLGTTQEFKDLKSYVSEEMATRIRDMAGAALTPLEKKLYIQFIPTDADEEDDLAHKLEHQIAVMELSTWVNDYANQNGGQVPGEAETQAKWDSLDPRKNRKKAPEKKPLLKRAEKADPNSDFVRTRLLGWLRHYKQEKGGPLTDEEEEAIQEQVLSGKLREPPRMRGR
jgi:hypothetical protein